MIGLPSWNGYDMNKMQIIYGFCSREQFMFFVPGMEAEAEEELEEVIDSPIAIAWIQFFS